MTPDMREVAGAAITRSVLDLAEVIAARTVAAYLSIGTEPATQYLVEALRSRDVRVVVPVLRDDLDLDWAEYDGMNHLAQGLRGLWTPEGALLGVDAVADADVVVVPALAVDDLGVRLGRGGGSYDRALARVPAGRAVIALLYDGERRAAVPAERHDRRVTTLVTPSGVLRFA
ncbi:MAG: 5-formyltetrahydrofolate cyclo-ligase [Actinomycetota bacterium]|jgi:5-formyltetrahydrofolate cyclo-ligase|nr:5-formyltetrahydrofolate cyclo-ligase [Actinomycetota bacterium]MDQ1664336.1 5-formyltetrahydrofolate cyclo-ligase [Actinomycetota bacterium]